YSRRIAQHRLVRLRQRLLRPRVLALRARAAVCREAGGDGDRLSADAGPGVVQPRSGEEEDRGDEQEPARPLAWRQNNDSPGRSMMSAPGYLALQICGMSRVVSIEPAYPIEVT